MWLVGDPSSRLHMESFVGVNHLFERLLVSFIEYVRAQKTFIRAEMEGSASA